MSKIIEDMNHYSNNFIAEQLVSLIGNGSRSKGLSKINSYLSKRADSAEFTIDDGSGLSHDNRLTASLITDLLVENANNPNQAPELEKSLAISNRQGTLKKRTFSPRANVVRGKTGTINRVTGLAGYIQNAQNRKIAFAILQNDVSNVSTARKLEADLIKEFYNLLSN